MKSIREKIPGKDGYLNIVSNGDYEYVDPFAKIFETFFYFELNMIRSIADLKADEISKVGEGVDKEKVYRRLAEKQAMKEFEKYIKEIESLPKSEKLLSLLTMTDKKEQVRTLKGISLTSNELMAMILEACAHRGYTYSMYTSHHDRRDLEKDKMPRLAYKEENGDILAIGQTSLSEGQIKSAIEQKKDNVARFIDNGPNWHCFFYTFNSVAGKESGGVPHIHYISHLWGWPRAEVLRQLKNRDYKLPDPRPHIPFERYK